MTTKKSPPEEENSFNKPLFDYGPLPETPPAHVWALKALRNQLLGTRPSPLTATTTNMDDEIDEVFSLSWGERLTSRSRLRQGDRKDS